uniref:Uncharacterized protein n=1 Tax=Ciona intestinalis TaxID=7719 RepID=H2Y0F7_CIOIN
MAIDNRPRNREHGYGPYNRVNPKVNQSKNLPYRRPSAPRGAAYVHVEASPAS